MLEHCRANADANVNANVDASESTCPLGFRLPAPNLDRDCSSPAIYHIIQDSPEMGVDDVLIEESKGRSGWRCDIMIGGREILYPQELYGLTVATALGFRRCLSVCSTCTEARLCVSTRQAPIDSMAGHEV